mgnify:CR=1 FL=1
MAHHDSIAMLICLIHDEAFLYFRRAYRTRLKMFLYYHFRKDFLSRQKKVSYVLKLLRTWDFIFTFREKISKKGNFV